MDNLLSLEETKSFLGIDQTRIDELARTGKLHTYKLGGSYLRFRKEEVLSLKQELFSDKKIAPSISWPARLVDFWRFNNFYILSLFVIAVLFLIVSRF